MDADQVGLVYVPFSDGYDDTPPENPVFCEDCDNVHEQSRKEQPYRWLCRARPRPTRQSYTTRSAIIGEPFERCERCNPNGTCELFTPRRHPKEQSNVS